VGGEGTFGDLLWLQAAQLLVGSLVGAAVLRGAVWVYNAGAGGPDSPRRVPAPDRGKALLVVFLAQLADAAFCVALAAAALWLPGSTPAAQPGGAEVAVGAGEAGSPSRLEPLEALLAALLLAVRLAVLTGAMAALLRVALPTTWGRALLVTLLYDVAAAVILSVLLFFAGVGVLMPGGP
jgi:hypothetical protein